MQKDSIDLMNVDYDDVLHLYRGWRRSESALKDKDKEMGMLKSKMKQLQDAHNQFRSQIQGLEAVKELTITLQNQLGSLQQENKQLVAENKELALLNLNAEQLLKEKETEETENSRLLKSVQLQFATLQGRYEETVKAQKELEKITLHEQSQRMAFESRLIQSDRTIQGLKEENRDLKEKLDTAMLQLNQCDQQLLHATNQLTGLSREVAHISDMKDELNAAEAQISVLKADMTRLLKLLEFSPSTRDFIAQWMDSGGMHFVGIDSTLEASFLSREEEDEYPEQEEDEEDEHSRAVTPLEFAHLKRIHGRDPFPLPDTLQEECENWVPKDVLELGLQFLRTAFPQASPALIMDYLRKMNKIWLRRERRKLRAVREALQSEIEDLRRQLSQARPYDDVLAKRQIKRLKSQVQTQRSKQLTGRPQKKYESRKDERKMFEDLDYMDIHGTAHSHPHSTMRICSRMRSPGDKNVLQLSIEKLAESRLMKPF